MVPWLKVVANITTQEKFITAGPVAGWLWLGGVGYCRMNTTDGFIPKTVVPGLVPGLKGAYRHAAALVAAGLWEDAVGGYRVHDYFDFNPSKAQVEHWRQKDKDRKREERASASEDCPDGQSPAVQTDNARTSDECPDGRLTRVRDTRGAQRASSPSLSESLQGSAVEKAEPSPSAPTPDDTGRVVSSGVAWNPRGAPISGRGTLHDGGLARTHAMHAFCGRLCVPWGLHSDFQARLGGADPAARLLAWYPTVLARYADQALGDDLFAFWRNEFAAFVGTVTSKPAAATGKGAATMAGVERGLMRYAARKAQEQP